MKEEIVNFRLSKDLKFKLQKLADLDNRKLGDYIRLQLQKMVDDKKMNL